MISLHHQILRVAIALLTCSLCGCAYMNEKAADAIGDYVPKWAGGLPADAPPRPGTAKYDEWMRERERQRLLPADQQDKPASAPTSSPPSTPSAAGSTSSNTSASGLSPVH